MITCRFGFFLFIWQMRHQLKAFGLTFDLPPGSRRSLTIPILLKLVDTHCTQTHAYIYVFLYVCV